MEWLKKNLFLIGWGALALALTVVAFLFLLSGQARHEDISLKLEEESRELQRLYNANPSPSPVNVDQARKEQERVGAFLGEMKQLFPASATPPMDTPAFKRFLDDSIYKMQRDAEAARVTLPPNYSFTFAIARSAVRFAPGSLEPLVARIEEVKALCHILFQARIHSLDMMRRVPVSADDDSALPDYLPRRATTNELTGMLVVPYEVTFTGFSTELAGVLEGFLRSPQFFVIKNIAVENAPLGGTNAPATPRPAVPSEDEPPPPDEPPTTPTPAPTTTLRSATRPTPTRGGLVVLLNEKLLKITMMLDVIVPSPAPAATAAPVATPQ